MCDLKTYIVSVQEGNVPHKEQVLIQGYRIACILLNRLKNLYLLILLLFSPSTFYCLLPTLPHFSQQESDVLELINSF